MFNTSLSKKRVIGTILVLACIGMFVVFNRVPKLDTVREDLQVVTAPQVECFQGFCIERDTEESFLRRWWNFSVTYLQLVAVGMTFAFVVAGLAEAFLLPRSDSRAPKPSGTVRGLVTGSVLGPVWNLCSACIVPVAGAFHRRVGAGGTIAMVQGSATLNIPALVMVALVFSPILGISRVVLSVLGVVLVGPLVASVIRDNFRQDEAFSDSPGMVDTDASWGNVLRDGLRDWVRYTLRYLVRLGPVMVVAGFASGLVIQWIDTSFVATYLGNSLRGVAIAATIGILINVPLLFEIPLVALLLLLGMGTAPAAALLFTAAAGGPITFWGLSKIIPTRAVALYGTATWAIGLLGGAVLLGTGLLQSEPVAPLRGAMAPAFDQNSNSGYSVREISRPSDIWTPPELVNVGDSGLSASLRGLAESVPEPVVPFSNVAPQALVHQHH